MTPLTNAHTLSQAQHAVRWLAVLLLLVAAGFVALVVRGTFDPRPCGSAALVDSAQLGSLALAGRGETFEQQPFPFAGTPSCYAVRLTAAHITGEMDSGYGLAIGDRNAALVVAVSPL
ncbi:MAG: hypothetical protein KA170_13715, partial [Candidatus Promineofilum sp.]|nr:hypothetical protein [Promineifilum sp.]